MSISVDIEEFTDALKVVHPFTNKSKLSGGEYEPFELVFFNTTTQGQLAVSAFSGTRSFVTVLVGLDATDGEAIEFAIHRDDVATLTNHFRVKKFRDDEPRPYLEVDIRHEDFREPSEQGTKVSRSTVLDFKESGVLLHARELRMNGVDSRPASVWERWEEVSRLVASARPSPMMRYLRPQDTIVLNKACSIYDQPLVRMSSRYLMASIGSWFFAVFELTERREDAVHAKGFESWAQDLEELSRAFPHENIYLEEKAA